ncbi:MAG: hypothetical protein RIQ79_2155 [Verrucomicrobiota bacterium]|jgi:hypothetical protein
MPPMAMKGLPAIFVPADESGVVPPLAPLMSKNAQATIGTRPPMMLSPRVAGAIAGKSESTPPIMSGAGKKKVRARRDLVIFALVFLLIAGGVGGGLIYYLNPWGATAAVSTVKAKLDEASQLPGQAVGKAQKAMDLARAKEQAKLEAAIKGDDLAPTTKPADPTPIAEVSNPATKTVAGARDTTTNNRVTVVPGDGTTLEPNANFVKWGGSLRVSGVFQGTPARALIDGRLVRQGELIEPVLGVKFDSVDASRKQIILKDETGAQVRLKY